MLNTMDVIFSAPERARRLSGPPWRRTSSHASTSTASMQINATVTDGATVVLLSPHFVLETQSLRSASSPPGGVEAVLRRVRITFDTVRICTRRISPQDAEEARNRVPEALWEQTLPVPIRTLETASASQGPRLHGDRRGRV